MDTKIWESDDTKTDCVLVLDSFADFFLEELENQVCLIEELEEKLKELEG